MAYTVNDNTNYPNCFDDTPETDNWLLSDAEIATLPANIVIETTFEDSVPALKPYRSLIFSGKPLTVAEVAGITYPYFSLSSGGTRMTAKQYCTQALTSSVPMYVVTSFTDGWGAYVYQNVSSLNDILSSFPSCICLFPIKFFCYFLKK